MAVKTITIDMAAYDLLSSQKSPNESFSKFIHRRLAPKKTAKGLLKVLPELALDPDTLGKMEAIVMSRKSSMAESLELH
ncbi:MAG TPA: antitoxin VapB family protein [Kiritimatiellia bacterium]|nr:antitoxin VapB family protein [Kiritimatiellia bacterium]